MPPALISQCHAYEDFLRQRRLPLWDRQDPRRKALDGQSGQGGRDGRTAPAVPTYAEITANGALTLLAVVRPLLDRQVASLADRFTKEGGFTERLYRVRRQTRDGVTPPKPPTPYKPPDLPKPRARYRPPDPPHEPPNPPRRKP